MLPSAPTNCTGSREGVWTGLRQGGCCLGPGGTTFHVPMRELAQPLDSQCPGLESLQHTQGPAHWRSSLVPSPPVAPACLWLLGPPWRAPHHPHALLIHRRGGSSDLPKLTWPGSGWGAEAKLWLPDSEPYPFLTCHPGQASRHGMVAGSLAEPWPRGPGFWRQVNIQASAVPWVRARQERQPGDRAGAHRPP